MTTDDTRRAVPELWTEADIKARLEDAADVMRRLRAARWTTPPGFISSWPEIVRDTWESLRSDDGPRRPAPPHGIEIDCMDETLGWIERIGDEWELDRLVRRHGHRRADAERAAIDRRRIVWARACGVSWRRLEDRDGRSRTTLAKIQREGLAAIGRYLNGARNLSRPE